MDIKYGNFIDLSMLKDNVLRDLKAQSEFWRKKALNLKDYTQPTKFCPICGSSGAKKAVIIHGFDIMQCEKCTHAYNSQMLTFENRKRFYEATDEEINYSDTYTDAKVQEYRLEHVAKPKVTFIDKYIKSKPAKWLDLACGNGDVLSVAKEMGYEAMGVDPNPVSVKYAKTNYGLELYQSTMEEYLTESNQLFDIISLLGITDLVSDPMVLIKRSAGLIKANGIMAASFPNFDSFSTTVQAAFPDQIVCRHLFPTTQSSYTLDSAQHALKKAGLTVEAIYWYGMDLYELAYNMVLMNPDTKKTGLYKMLFQFMNELQLVFDKAEKSDEFLIVARKAP